MIIVSDISFDPKFFTDYSLNNLNRNIVPFCNNGIRTSLPIIFSSYISNLFPRKLRFPMFISFRWICVFNSSFFKSISHIVSMRSNPQMGRINASRIIARMTNIHSFWNLSLVNRIRKSMSKHQIRSAWRVVKSTITPRAFRSLPNPAIFCFFNPFKKPINS